MPGGGTLMAKPPETPRSFFARAKSYLPDKLITVSIGAGLFLNMAAAWEIAPADSPTPNRKLIHMSLPQSQRQHIRDWSTFFSCYQTDKAIRDETLAAVQQPDRTFPFDPDRITLHLPASGTKSAGNEAIQSLVVALDCPLPRVMS